MRHVRAFSLVEAALSVLLVGGLVIAATEGVGRVAKARASAAQQQRGVALAQRLMSEIMALPFADPAAGNTAIGTDGTEETNANRSTLNDVDDFDGLDESPLKNRASAALTDGSGWRWTASVYWVNPTTLARSISATNVKRVKVTVYSAGRKAAELESLRTAGGDIARTSGRASSSSATISHTSAVSLP